jgi:hypothetical protein
MVGCVAPVGTSSKRRPCGCYNELGPRSQCLYHFYVHNFQKNVGRCGRVRVESQSTDSPTSFKFLTHLKKVLKSTAISSAREGDLELDCSKGRSSQASRERAVATLTEKTRRKVVLLLEPAAAAVAQFRAFSVQASARLAFFCQKNQIPVVSNSCCGKAIASDSPAPLGLGM